jgi:hypothetical protein
MGRVPSPAPRLRLRHHVVWRFGRSLRSRRHPGRPDAAPCDGARGLCRGDRGWVGLRARIGRVPSPAPRVRPTGTTLHGVLAGASARGATRPRRTRHRATVHGDFVDALVRSGRARSCATVHEVDSEKRGSCILRERAVAAGSLDRRADWRQADGELRAGIRTSAWGTRAGRPVWLRRMGQSEVVERRCGGRRRGAGLSTGTTLHGVLAGAFTRGATRTGRTRHRATVYGVLSARLRGRVGREAAQRSMGLSRRNAIRAFCGSVSARRGPAHRQDGSHRPGRKRRAASRVGAERQAPVGCQRRTGVTVGPRYGCGAATPVARFCVSLGRRRLVHRHHVAWRVGRSPHRPC